MATVEFSTKNQQVRLLTPLTSSLMHLQMLKHLLAAAQSLLFIFLTSALMVSMLLAFRQAQSHSSRLAVVRCLVLTVQLYP